MKPISRFNLILIVGLALIIATFGFLISRYGFEIQGKERGTIELMDSTGSPRDGEKFLVEIADTPLERSQGLSGRSDLGSNEGMLFLFEKSDYYGFWMKGMLIPIDIIWIKDNKIIGFEKSVSPEPGVPESDLKKYLPSEPVDKVLEVSAGTVERLGIQAGDEIVVNYN